MTPDTRYLWLSVLIALVLILSPSNGSEVPSDKDNNSYDPRIVGGFQASANSTRHQVSIRRKTTDLASFGSGHFCGGSLINNRTVLTAAHCLVDDNHRKRAASYFRVVGGSTTRMQATTQTEIRDVSRVTIHAKYNPSTFENDIGILILSEIIPTSHPSLRPIEQVTTAPSAGAVCQTSGWGTRQYGVIEATPYLMAVNITVQQITQCNASTSYQGILSKGMLCAGQFEGGRDACQGDSGGPLVCNGLLAGVVSFGNECAKPGYPGIYADVAYYREWIRENGASRSGIAKGAFALFVYAIASFVGVYR
ncbi:trypsin-2-like [Wyeomyia smithii]|uniref:trypsin-2-like n=1 Tax=Wyeomyia smithii TaxID=174621 RepID=UPI002467CEC2|nr:trypsin-2-like [Wyeomyia smithii]